MSIVVKAPEKAGCNPCLKRRDFLYDDGGTVREDSCNPCLKRRDFL